MSHNNKAKRDSGKPTTARSRLREIVGVPRVVHGRHPVPMTPEQRDELHSHLADKFDEATALDMLERIYVAHKLAAMDIESEAWLQSIRTEEINKARDHYKRVADLARELNAALGDSPPHGPMSELSSAGHTLDWTTLQHSLEFLETVAEAEAATHKAGRRPKVQWRSDLIVAVADIFGAEAKRSRKSHFERTIELLLESLNQKGGSEGVHGAVVAALKSR